MRGFVLLSLLAATPAVAEVKSSSANAFEVERKAVVKAAPQAVYAQIGRVGEWWDPSHTYSGKGANLSLELKAGGCFCETLDNGGSVEHGRVVYFDPSNAIRLSGALGPLQSSAAVGTMIWSFKPVAGGTELTQTYRVYGDIGGGADKIAPIVDQVLGSQFDRLRARLGG